MLGDMGNMANMDGLAGLGGGLGGGSDAATQGSRSRGYNNNSDID